MILRSSYKILECILSNPGVRLGELAQKSSVSVQRTMQLIRELLSLHVLREETLRSGNRVIIRRFYSFLTSEEGLLFFSSFELEKRALFLKRNPQLIGPLQDIVRELSQIECIVIFGSFARFSQTKESDLDLLFLVRKSYDREKMRKILERTFVTFSHEVSLKVMNFHKFRNSDLYESIARDHVVVKGIRRFLEALR